MFRKIITVLLLLLAPCVGQGQSMTVLTSGTDARRCAMEAELVGDTAPVGRAALEHCTRALEHGQLNPRDTAATLVNRGIIHAAVREFPEALADYNRALEIRPELAEPYVGRGNLVYMAGRFDLAVEEYDKALERGLQRQHVGWFNRGLALEKQGNTEAAAASYRRALELRPQWPLARERLDALEVAD